MKRLTQCLVCCIILTTPLFAAESNWSRWRGPHQNGTVSEGTYPVSWTVEDALWKIDIPGKGFSTPVVYGKTIFLTSGVDDADTVLAYDLSGNQLWQKKLGPEQAGKHKNGSGSNPSPVTDGDAVFVFFRSGTFAALEMDGTVRWKKNLFDQYGKDDRFWSFGTSPVLTKKHVVMAQMHDGPSWLAAFDRATGDVVWKVARDYETPTEGSQSYTTPVVYSHKGTEALLVWGGMHLTSHDAADGKVIWSCGDFNPESESYWPSIGTPLITDKGDIAIVPCGRSDRGQPRLHGIKMGGAGDITKTARLWKRDDIGPCIPCPTEYKGRVYLVDDRGRIDCIDPATGKSIWTDQFPKGKGNFYASPLIASGHLYAMREDGTVFVLKPGDTFQIISQIDMQDVIIASPVAVSDRLLIRTRSHLYCIGEK